MSKIVAIVGRPNVGKSTFFNRMTGSRKAIVDDTSGVTRDRHYGISDWNGKEFIVVDTGGYVAHSDDFFEKAIRRQAEIAISEADAVLFMVDVTTGITDEDAAFAQQLRKGNKPVLVVVNKVDNTSRLNDIHEFHRLGLGELFPVSSMSGSGTGDLLDKVIEIISPAQEEPFVSSQVAEEEGENEGEKQKDEEEKTIPKFAIVGRPNVGKSTFLNVLTEQERNIVSDVPGTTRDSIHTLYNKFGMSFWLIDTAGIRKKGKVNEDIEFYSVMRAISALEDADIVFLMIDAMEGFQAQDVNLFSLAKDRKKGIVILVNKWDKIEKDTHTALQWQKDIEEKIAPFSNVPILFISALDKVRIHKALELGMEVYKNRKQKISTSRLNDVMQQAIKANHPPSVKGKFVTIKYVTQLPGAAPIFAFFCNLPQYIREPYKRYLENKLREAFPFEGVPLKLFFRKK